MRFSHSSPILLSLLLGVCLPLAGCGGGGSNPTVNQPNNPNNPGGANTSNPLFTTSKLIDTTGNTLSAPDPYNVNAVFAPGSLNGSTSVALAVHSPNTVPTPNTGLAANSRTINLQFDTATLSNTGKVTITAPYNADVDSEIDFVVMSDNAGNFLPILPTFNTAAKTVSFDVVKADFDYFTTLKSAHKSASRNIKRGLANTFWWDLRHINRIVRNPRVDFRHYLQSSTASGLDRWKISSSASSDELNWDDSNKRIAIVLHGINNDVTRMRQMADYLLSLRMADGRSLYTDVWGVDYEWQSNIGDNAEIVAEFINSRLQNSASRVDIFGHSMGGLVARWAIEKADLKNGIVGCGARVNRLFTFGTPHEGVPLRALATSTIYGITSVGGIIYFDLKYPGVNDLASHGSFLNRLDDDSTSPYFNQVAYSTFAGNHWKGYLQFTKGPVISAIGDIVETIYDGANKDMDGIVPVSSAQYSGLSHKSANWTHPAEHFHFNHSEMGGTLNGDNDPQSFDLEHDPGSADGIDPSFNTGMHKPLRYYLLNSGSGQIDIR